MVKKYKFFMICILEIMLFVKQNIKNSVIEINLIYTSRGQISPWSIIRALTSCHKFLLMLYWVEILTCAQSLEHLPSHPLHDSAEGL